MGGIEEREGEKSVIPMVTNESKMHNDLDNNEGDANNLNAIKYENASTEEKTLVESDKEALPSAKNKYDNITASDENLSLDIDSTVEPFKIPSWLGWCFLVFITIVGGFYRFYDLELKPLHHDEGVNGWFLIKIFKDHVYRYNPKNYHGPLLYFLDAISVLFGGKTVFALRFMQSFFGTAVIMSVALLRPIFGWAGVLVVASFIAIAPMEVYFSRTAIHEIFNFIFNLTFFASCVAWLYSPKRIYAICAGISISALFATKETTIITIAAMFPSFFLALFLGKNTLFPLSASYDWRLPQKFIDKIYFLWSYLKLFYQKYKTELDACFIAFLVVWVLLFSSLLTNPRGLVSFFEAFFRWGDTGTSGKGHEKAWPYFWNMILWPYYRPVLIFGGLGLIIGLFKRNRWAVFVFFWFLFSSLAYTLIPYKTPWCVLSFSGPLFLGLGFFTRYMLSSLFSKSLALKFASLFSFLFLLLSFIPYGFLMPSAYYDWLYPKPSLEKKSEKQPIISSIAQIIFSPYDSYTINFLEYDVKGHPFIYVQNVREYLDLISDLKGLVYVAQKDSGKKSPKILMIDAKNPLRWYIQSRGTQTWAKKPDEEQVSKKIPNDVDIILVSKEHKDSVQKIMDKYPEFLSRSYFERPGRKITLYIRRDLWSKYVLAGNNGEVNKAALPEVKSYSDKRTEDMKKRYAWSKRGMN